MSEPHAPSAGPTALPQLACAGAVLVAAVVGLPAQQLMFLGEPVNFSLRDSHGGPVLICVALAGALLAALQLALVRRRAAVVAAVAGVWVGLGIAGLGARIGFFHDLDPRMHPTAGPAAVLTVVAGLAYAGLASLRVLGLTGAPRGAAADAPSPWHSRGRRRAVLLLPGAAVVLALAVATFAPRPGRDDEDDWQPPVPAGVVEEEERLRGAWLVDRTESPDVTARGSRLTFDGDRVTGFGPTTRREPYRIDPTRRPKEIDFVIRVNGEPVWLPAIYDLDGDRLTLCAVVFAPETGPDAGQHRRPRSFTDYGTAYVWHCERERTTR